MVGLMGLSQEGPRGLQSLPGVSNVMQMARKRTWMKKQSISGRWITPCRNHKQQHGKIILFQHQKWWTLCHMVMSRHLEI